MSGEDVTVGVECGRCGGPIYFATCPVESHEWAVASECQGECRQITMVDGGCPECDVQDG